MNELHGLPDGWEWKEINHVVVKTKNKSPKNNPEKEFTYIDISSINNSTFTIDTPKILIGSEAPSRAKKEVFKNDIVFATTRPNLKNIAIVREEYNNPIASTGFCILRADETIQYQYLFFYVLSNVFYKQVEKNIRGAQYPAVSDTDVRSINIPFPPLQEQKRIVSKLDTLFEKIDKAIALHQKNMDETDVFMGSILNEVFGNKIYGLGGEALEDLCELIVDCEHKTAPTQETGYPSIRTPNIGKGFLILDNVNRVSKETYNEWTKRAIPQENDLILAREAPAGNVAVIPKNLKVCLGQRTVLLRPKKDKFNSNYLAFLLLSKDVQQQLLAHSRGATVSHINMKDIRAFKIYNLLSLSEQQKTVIYLDKISEKTEKVKQVQKEKMESLKALKASILDRAFRGEL